MRISQISDVWRTESVQSNTCSTQSCRRLRYHSCLSPLRTAREVPLYSMRTLPHLCRASAQHQTFTSLIFNIQTLLLAWFWSLDSPSLLILLQSAGSAGHCLYSTSTDRSALQAIPITTDSTGESRKTTSSSPAWTMCQGPVPFPRYIINIDPHWNKLPKLQK